MKKPEMGILDESPVEKNIIFEHFLAAIQRVPKMEVF